MSSYTALYEYEFYVPRYLNSGKLVPQTVWKTLRKKLTTEFGGCTELRYKNVGRWAMDNAVYVDEIVIFRVLTVQSRPRRKFVANLKRSLTEQLKQKDLLVTRRSISRLGP